MVGNRSWISRQPGAQGTLFLKGVPEKSDLSPSSKRKLEPLLILTEIPTLTLDIEKRHFRVVGCLFPSFFQFYRSCPTSLTPSTQMPSIEKEGTLCVPSRVVSYRLVKMSRMTNPLASFYFLRAPKKWLGVKMPSSPALTRSIAVLFRREDTCAIRKNGKFKANGNCGAFAGTVHQNKCTKNTVGTLEG